MKKRLNILVTVILAVSFIFTGCKKDDPIPTVTVSDFEVTIAENPTLNQSVGTVSATTENTSNKGFYFTNLNASGDLSNYVSLNSNTGEILITDPSYFDYELHTTITSDAYVEAFNSSDEMASATFTITINITNVAEYKVQERLDNGETPLEIYNSDNTLLDSLYGKTYAGGHIFDFNTTTGNGMVVNYNDFISIAWDYNSTGLVATGAVSTAVGTGVTNTTTIVASIGSGGSYAAYNCDQLTSGIYSDWFLPSLDELELMYDNLHAKGLSTFINAKYWSSSELDANSAWTRDFAVTSGQTAVTVNKTITHFYKPVRAF